ncbi:MAG: phosphopantothenoylcysteine decarboxylase, partial [Bacteroidetes bacterium]|nr:phosphopantothenoylcysteine decarboxylase [Bacteroidota bacterium]
LAGLGAVKRDGQRLVGFALETDNGLEHAKGKLERKRLDWIVLNNPNEDGAGFGTGTNRVTLLAASGARTDLPVLPKTDVAEAILEIAVLGTDPDALDPVRP